MLFFKVCNGFVNMDMLDSYGFKEVYRGYNGTLHVIMIGQIKGNIIG